MRSYCALVFLSAIVTAPLSAHEGGHHPAVTDSGHYGGLVTTLTEKRESHDHSHHHKAPHDDHDHQDHETTARFKAELVRSADGTVHLYLYNDAMNALDPKSLGSEVKSTLVQGSGKKTKKDTFTLKLIGKSYTGVSPSIIHKPYAMEFFVAINGKEQQASFSNLD